MRHSTPPGGAPRLVALAALLLAAVVPVQKIRYRRDSYYG